MVAFTCSGSYNLTDLIQWDAAGHHFLRLQSLVLNHCSNLETIPSAIAEVSALRTWNCTGLSRVPQILPESWGIKEN